MLSKLTSSELIMTMLWLMMTGAFIWGMDNFLKRFENTMEDGFRKQARNINDGFRVNMTLLIISISVFTYYKYYLRQDTSQLQGLLGNLIELVASIGEFLLYLLAYLVHWGYKYLGGDYQTPAPSPSEGVILGFIIILSYVVVKRMFFRKTPPMVWAVIVAAVMLGFNFLSQRTGIDLKKLFNRTNRVTTDSIPNNNNDTIQYNPDDLVITDDNNGDEEDEGDVPVDDNVTFPDEDILIFNENLHTAIEEFALAEQRSEPRESDYKDNQLGYERAITEHINDMLNSQSYRKLSEMLKEYRRKGILKSFTIRTTIKDELCEFYSTYFDDKICPASNVPIAN